VSKVSGRTQPKRSASASQNRAQTVRAPGGPRRSTVIAAAVITVFAVIVLYLIYQTSQPTPEASGGGSGYQHVAGEPGIGDPAPAFTLSASTGGEISLADYRDQAVLLFFQEGLMCQPCVDQITDLEQHQAALAKAGVDKVISISHDPLGQVRQVAADSDLSTPWLSDPTQRVIRAYDAHKYGMMQGTTAGHSFLLVGPDGTIQWRADYGGPPDYTMFVPTKRMLADLAQERAS